MMRLITGYGLLFGNLLLRILPVAVTAVLSCVPADGKKGKGREGHRQFFLLPAIGAVHFLLYLLLRYLLLHNLNVFGTVQKILLMQFSYQDLGYFTWSFLASMGAAVLLGVLPRAGAVLLRKESRLFTSPGTKGRIVLFLSFAGAGIAAVGCCAVRLSGTAHVVINEVCGNNSSHSVGENGAVSDYIELYNRGWLACELEGLYLSDGRTASGKKQLPSCELPAGGYLLISLDDGSFSLKKEGGETIYLSDASGKVLDSMTMEKAGTDFSCARQTDGDPVWTVLSCTPGMANEEAVSQLKSPVLSHKSGFYQSAFELELSSEPGTVIYYTLDGSIPTEQSFLYQEPIHVYDRSGEENIYRAVPNVIPKWRNSAADQKPVDKAFIIRAVAVDREGESRRVSSPVTATYFIGLDQYAQKTVISLVADAEDLFGDDGICVTGQAYDQWYLGGKEGSVPYMNFHEKGREWEIAANIECFSEKLSFSQNVGMRIFGGTSRAFPLKNFSLYARKEYGGSRFFDRYIFDDTVSHKLTVRGGFANALCQTLAKDRAVAVQSSIPVSVFLNGEFWYHTNLMEKYDEYYFEQRYGAAPDNLILFSQGYLDIGKEEDLVLEQDFYDFLDEQDMADASNYRALGEIMDLQSYIDFMCINIYVDNMDFDNMKNVVMWRVRDRVPGPYGDGKWRWALYDLDAMEWGYAEDWGLSSTQEKNTFCLMPRDVNAEISINQQRIYTALKENPDFCRQFVLTFMDLANQNFNYERVKAEIEAYGYESDGYQGGGLGGGTQPLDYYDSFFRERAFWIIPYMAEEFGLSGTREDVILSVNDPEAGAVQINTITPDLSKGPWSGEYYTDYPVIVTAKACVGYEFVGWEKTVLSNGRKTTVYRDKTMEIPVEKGGIRLNAVFRKVR